MKIGFAQFRPLLGDLEANRQAVRRLAEGASGLDLLVFPELANSGYNFASRQEAAQASEEAGRGPFQDLLAGICASRRMHIVSGFCERDGARLYNSAVLVGPDGLLGRYRKIHLFMNEKDIFTPGDLGFPVFDIPLDGTGEPCRVGILICFDWQFPEAWRVLALGGADVVCHPSNLVLPGKAQRAVPLHAMLNRLFVVLANRTGEERGVTFTGESLIAAPSGQVLATASPDGEETRWVECDPREARNKMVTPRNDLIADRRPEFYAEVFRNAPGTGPVAP